MREGLYLGDLSGPESRLTLLWLGVRGVVPMTASNPSPSPNPSLQPLTLTPSPVPSPSAPALPPRPKPRPNAAQVTVASHDIERLWMADGIAYH